jgi:hypothetical protein
MRASTFAPRPTSRRSSSHALSREAALARQVLHALQAAARLDPLHRPARHRVGRAPAGEAIEQPALDQREPGTRAGRLQQALAQREHAVAQQIREGQHRSGQLALRHASLHRPSGESWCRTRRRTGRSVASRMPRF